jgi:hypothetical protein
VSFFFSPPPSLPLSMSVVKRDGSKIEVDMSRVRARLEFYLGRKLTDQELAATTALATEKKISDASSDTREVDQLVAVYCTTMLLSERDLNTYGCSK